LEYNIPLFRDSSVTSFFEVSREVSRDKDISGRCKDVTSLLYEAVRYRYEATRYKDDKNVELKVCSKKVEGSRCSFRDKLKWETRKISKSILENLIKPINKFLTNKLEANSTHKTSIQRISTQNSTKSTVFGGKLDTKHPEPRTFPLQPCEVRTSCMDS
jgi:predicted DNA-binding protein (UPF0251 family)